MKKIVVLIASIVTLFNLNLKSQEKFAIIDLKKNYQIGNEDGTYLTFFQLNESFNAKDIDNIRDKSLKFEYVKDVTISKNTNGFYDVKLLLSNLSEDVSGYFGNFLLSVSINYVKIGSNILKTTDYYSYISQLKRSKEINNKTDISKNK